MFTTDEADFPPVNLMEDIRDTIWRFNLSDEKYKETLKVVVFMSVTAGILLMFPQYMVTVVVPLGIAYLTS